MKTVSNLPRIFLPLLVLALGILGMIALVKSRKQPKREEPRIVITPVKAVTVTPSSFPLVVEAAGTVLPSRQVALRPQVSGQVTEVSEMLQPGGFFREGEVLMRIDPRDYAYAVERQKAQVEKANFEVIREKGRQAVAEREWNLLGEELESSPEGKDLALRKPQLRQALAALEAAKSSLAEAELNLERTVIRAPFNALIKDENVDPGQFITTQTTVATLTGTDRYWVRASLPVSQIGLFSLPDRDGGYGARAQIIHETGPVSIEKTGRIIRLLGDLEETGRMARVLIAIDDPLALQSSDAPMPLLLDAYVHVAIEGNTLEGVFSVPTSALREGDRLWLIDAEDTLAIRNVNVVRREKTRILVDRGLSRGDRVITSRIVTPIPGMKLRQIEEEDLIAPSAISSTGEGVDE